MSFPAMSPHSVIHIPSNAKANITALPVLVPVKKITITGVSVVPNAALTGADARYILLKLIQLANASNVVATINIKTGVNLVANTVREFTINDTLAPVGAGTVLGLTANFNDVANAHMGTEVGYQIDYVQGAPGAEA